MDGDASMESAAFAEALAHPSGVADKLDLAIDNATEGKEHSSDHGSERTGRGMITSTPTPQPPNPNSGSPVSSNVESFRKAQEESRKSKASQGTLYQALISPHYSAVLEHPPESKGKVSEGRVEEPKVQGDSDSTFSVERGKDPLHEWAEDFNSSEVDPVLSEEGEENEPEVLGREDGVDHQEFVEREKREERKRTSLPRGVKVIPMTVSGASSPRREAYVERKGYRDIGTETVGDWQSAMQAVMMKVEELEQLLVEEKRERREEYDLLLTKIEGRYSSPFGSEIGKKSTASRSAEKGEQGTVEAQGGGGPGPGSTDRPKETAQGPLVRDLVRRFISKYRESSDRAISVSLSTLLVEVKKASDVSTYPHHSRITVLMLQYLRDANIQGILNGMK